MRRLVQRLRLLPGWVRLRRSALFDAQWYRDSYPDLGSRTDPVWHYLTHGAGEGRDPGPLFSTSGYLLQTDPGTMPALLHYETHRRAADHAGGSPAALPVFVGTAPPPTDTAATVLFFAHQALGHQFGAERSLLHMLERALGAGLTVEVVVPQCLDLRYLDALRARAHQVHILPCPWRRAGRVPHPATLRAMIALIRARGASEVHQNTLALDAPLIAARSAGVPSVVWLRELPAQDNELCIRLDLAPSTLRRDLLAQADRFIANSAASAFWIDPEGTLPPERLLVLPNAVDPDLARLPFAPPTPLRVGMVSSNIAKKGIADMVALARASAARRLAARFVLIGPASADLAALGPLPDNLTHAGYAATPLAAMAQLDVLVSLSHFAESFGRTVLEALTAGRPVICYDRGTPPELVGTQGAGRVVAPDNPDAAAAALADLLQDPSRLMAASDAARKRGQMLTDQACAVPDALIYAHSRGMTRRTGRDS